MDLRPALLLFARQQSGSARSDNGSDSDKKSNSLSGMLSTFIPAFILACAFVAVFLAFRARKKRVYQPRTYVSTLYPYQRTPEPAPTTFGWIGEFWSTPDAYILNHHSLDGYLFLRFFKMLTVICLIGAFITWPILFPVYATGSGASAVKQFDLISFTPIANQPPRMLAPTLVSWVFLSIVLLIIARESLFYARLRQTYLLSPFVASRLSTRTVLFTDVPSEYLDEKRLRQIFPEVKHIWLATDTKDIEDLVEDRDKTAFKLEAAEVKLTKQANDARLKAIKKGEAPVEDSEQGPSRWLDDKARPTHKLKFLIGQKVDTIDWCRSHLAEVIPKLEALQAKHWTGDAKIIPAVFIEFETVQGAESAFQQLAWHTPKQFQPRTIGSRPQEIIWENLSMSWWQRDIRHGLAVAFISLMIIFWAIPVAFVGFISNINSLDNYSWLHWISKIPSSILGVVTGLLPVVLLAVLMALVPIICRIIAKKSGAASTVEVELTTQQWYFMFQVIQVFLVTTFTSGASSVISSIIDDPSSAPTLLANNLPKASNFYINYFVLQGVAIASGILINIGGFVVFELLARFLDKTPRKMYKRYSTLGGIAWGSVYPKFVNMGVIALSYSAIAPLVLGFATTAFFLVYVAYKYQLLYCLDTTSINTQGRNYAMAMQHLLAGVYLSELCMIGLFGISIGTGPAAAASLVLMIIFLVATLLFHIYLRSVLKPLYTGLPRDLLWQNAQLMGRSSYGMTEHGEYEFDSKVHPDKSSLHRIDDHETLSNTHSDDAGYNKNSIDRTHLTDTDKGVASKKKPAGIVAWALHPGNVPELDAHYQKPVPDFTPEIRREAYLDPAITSPTPLLWIVEDSMGISKQEKEASSKVIGTSDSGAWFNEKGRLETSWVAHQDEEQNMTDIPIYEEKPFY